MGWRSKFPTTPIYIGLATSVICVGAAAVFYAVKPPVYEASAGLAVGGDRQVAGENVAAAPPTGGRAVLTELEVIRSDGVLNLATKRLGLGDNEELRQSLNAEAVGGPGAVRVRVRHSEPNEAATWANAVARAYVEFRTTSIADEAAATKRVISRAIQNNSDKIAELRALLASNPPNADALRTEESRLVEKVGHLQNQLQGVAGPEAMEAGGARIIDFASPPKTPIERSWLPGLGVAAGLGLIGGTALSSTPRAAEYLRGLRRKKDDFDAEPSLVQPGSNSEQPLTGEVAASSEALNRIGEDLRGGMGEIKGRLAAIEERVGREQAPPGDGGMQQLRESLFQHFQAWSDRLAALEQNTLRISSGLQSQLAAAIEQNRQPADEMEERSGENIVESGQALEPAGHQWPIRVAKQVGRLDQQIRSTRAELNLRLEALERSDAAVAEQLITMREELFNLLAAQQSGMADKLGSIAATVDQDWRTVPARFEEIVERLKSFIEDHQTAVPAAIEGAKRGVLDDVREDRVQMAERMADLNHEMLQRFGKLAVKLHQELQATRNEVAEKLTAYEAELGNKLDSISAKMDEGEPALAARLEGLLGQISSQLTSHEEAIAGALDQARRAMVGEVREDRAELQEKIAERTHELLQRFASFSFRLEQNLEALRTDALEKVSTYSEGLERLGESVESKLGIEAKGFSGQMGRLQNELTAQSQMIESRISQAVSHLNASLLQKADINRAELVQRVATLDVEVSQRLGQVAMRLSEALASLRNEVAQKLSSSEQAIAAMLHSSEGSRAVESSEISRRLEGVSAELGGSLESLQARLLSSSDEMKKTLEKGPRAELDRLAQGLADIDREAAERIEKLSVSMKRTLRDLRARVSEELAAQQTELGARLESLETKVSDNASGTTKRLSGRLKSVEDSVTDMADHLKKRSGEAKPGRGSARPGPTAVRPAERKPRAKRVSPPAEKPSKKRTAAKPAAAAKRQR